MTLVHVMQAREPAGLRMNDALGWEISRQDARGYLDRLEQRASQALGEPVDTRLEQGRPAERILDLARELTADLCVLGSRGEGDSPAGTLGSTLQRVLAVASQSVFVAPPSAMTPSTVAPKRILVPLDGSLRSESVLPVATRIASAHGAEILLVHVVQEPSPTELLGAAEDMALARTLAARLEYGAHRYLERLRQRVAHEGTAVRALVARHANNRHCLLEISQREKADLLVISAHGSACDSAEPFGSVAASLLARSTIPLLVIQDLPERNVRQGQDAPTTLAPPSPRAIHTPAPSSSYMPENV
jgi:nucleotide-binding universal stress UspA family protein